MCAAQHAKTFQNKFSIEPDMGQKFPSPTYAFIVHIQKLDRSHKNSRRLRKISL